jgi:GNAT superfamily N-acetyltransferase
MTQETKKSLNELEKSAWLENQGKLDNNDTNILNRFSFYSYKDESNILYLSELYVNKEQRNKGIGTKILKIADEVAASMKCNLIRLKTEIGSNAERLYRKNGYNSLMMEGNQVWLEKQGEKKLSENAKTLDADKVIEWLKPYSVIVDNIINEFKKDFGL